MAKEKCIIDTNMLYDYVGANKELTDDRKAVLEELNRLDILVSEWSIMEMLTHEGFSDSDRTGYLKILSERKIPIIPSTISPTFKIVLNDYLSECQLALTDSDIEIQEKGITETDSNEKDLAAISERLKNEKINRETEIHRMYLYIYVVLYSRILSTKLENASVSKTKQSCFYNCLLSLLEGNLNCYYEQIHSVIQERYNGVKGTLVDNKITSIVYHAFFIISMNFDSIVNGTIMEVFPDAFKNYPDNLLKDLKEKNNIPTQKNAIVEAINNIGVEGLGTKRILTKKERDVFEIAKAELLGEIEKNKPYPLNTCKYIIAQCERFLFDGVKLRKNDAIDAHMLEWSDLIKIATYDKVMSNLLDKVNESLFDFNNELKC